MIRRLLFIRLPYFPTERIVQQKRKACAVPPAWWDKDALQRQERSDDESGPLVLVTHGAKGTRISAVSPEAQSEGLWVDMKFNDARAMLPHICVETQNTAEEMVLFERLSQWMLRYTPSVAFYPPYNMVLDITGCDHLFGGERSMAKDVIMRLKAMGFTPYCAVADCLAAAHALTHYGQKHIHILPQNHAIDLLDALPVEALRLDAATILLLKRLGLKKIGDVRTVPRAALERRFRDSQKSITKRHATQTAQSVQWRLDQLSGAIAEPLSYIKEPCHFRVTRPCPEMALEQSAVGIALDALLPQLCTMLNKAGKGARHYRLIGYRADGGSSAINITLSTPSHTMDSVRRLFKDRLEQIDCGFGIDLFLLEADHIEAVGQQQQAIVGAEERLQETGAFPPSIHQFTDVIRNHTGSESVQKLYPRASHVPERTQIFAPMTAPLNWAMWEDAHPQWSPRPPRLLARPEPAKVTAALPDSPPAQFIWRRVLRRVIRARGPERILPEWWHDDLKPKRSASFRDYYDVEDDKGLRYWIFRSTKDEPIEEDDGLIRSTHWYVHGLF